MERNILYSCQRSACYLILNFKSILKLYFSITYFKFSYNIDELQYLLYKMSGVSIDVFLEDGPKRILLHLNNIEKQFKLQQYCPNNQTKPILFINTLHHRLMTISAKRIPFLATYEYFLIISLLNFYRKQVCSVVKRMFGGMFVFRTSCHMSFDTKS